VVITPTTAELRSSTAEPVPGTLVNYLNMRRVNTGGIHQANKCMLMAAVVYNLKKLMKWTSKKVQTDVKAMQENLRAVFLCQISILSLKYLSLKP